MATPATTNPPSTAIATPAIAPEILPQPLTLLQASKLAIEQDKPILLDYYRETATATAFLGEDQASKERILIKSNDEFTSLIKKLYKAGDDYIILTENSIYIVSGKVQKKKVNLPNLMQMLERSG